MQERRSLKWSMTLILLILMFQNAYADIYMKQKQHTDAVTMMGQTQPAQNMINESWITSDKIVVINEKQKTVMDMNRKIISMVNHEKKIIIEMPMDFSKNIDKHKDMSSDEKAQFQKFMGNMMQIDMKVEETDERKKIGKWDCKKYLQTIKMAMGTTNSEIWATEDINIDADLYAKYSAGMLALMPGMSKNMGNIIEEIKKIKGIQVYSEQTMTMMGQAMKSSMELLDIKEEKAPSEVFDLPAGYQREGAFK